MEYKCNNCSEYFDTPHTIYESHNFTYGPEERWDLCPYCDSPDFDNTIDIMGEEDSDD